MVNIENAFSENEAIKEKDEYGFYIDDVKDFYKKEILGNLMKDGVGFIGDNAKDKKTLYGGAARATTEKQKNVIKEEIFDYSKKSKKTILAQKLSSKSGKELYLKQLEETRDNSRKKTYYNYLRYNNKSVVEKKEEITKPINIKRGFFSSIYNIFKNLKPTNNFNYKKKKII